MKTIGVDLGTTNTLAACEGKLLCPPGRRLDCALVPSVVAYLPNGAVVVGEAARRRRPIDPKNTLFSAKRVIGRPWLAYETARFRQNYPFEFVRGPGDTVGFQTRRGLVTPVDAAVEILEFLCRRTVVAPQAYRALITVPAQFDPKQRAATIEVGRAVGFADVAVLDEPIATGVAYAHAGVADVRYAVVYDLGGGTFDLAVLDCSHKPHRVVAHGGDAYLGGDDVDRALATWVGDHVLEQHHWDLRSDAEVFDRLVIEVERAKQRLTIAAETTVDLGQVDPASPLATTKIQMSRPVLEQACRPLVQRTFGICDEVLSQAGLRRDAVGAVLLAGGSTALPMVRRDVARYFGQPPHASFDPMEVVALGASLAAG